MSLHLILGILVLILASVIDFVTRRIPNRLLVAALTLHFLIAMILQRPHIGVRPFLFYVGIIALLFVGARSRELLIASIGMGDIKLIGYLVLFVAPHLNLTDWFFGMAVVSTLTLAFLYLSGRTESNIPFAPLILIGTITTLP